MASVTSTCAPSGTAGRCTCSSPIVATACRIREPDHTGGYGLRIVEDVTKDWGVVRGDDGGKVTWFTLTHAVLTEHSPA
jgi:hypothetical protein